MPRITDEEFNKRKELAKYAMDKGLSIEFILSYSGISRSSYFKYIYPSKKKDYSIYNGKTIKQIMEMRKCSKVTAYTFCKKYKIKFKSVCRTKRKKDPYAGQRYEDI